MCDNHEQSGPLNMKNNLLYTTSAIWSPLDANFTNVAHDSFLDNLTLTSLRLQCFVFVWTKSYVDSNKKCNKI